MPNQTSRESSNRLLHLALAVFSIGVLAIIAIFVIPAVSDAEPGLWLYLAAMAAPIGFLLAITFALRSGRRARPPRK